MTVLLIIIYFSFISLGLPDSILGSAWPVMHSFFGVPVTYAGFLSFTASGCTVVSSLLAMWLNRHLGTGKTVAISTLLTAVAMIAFSFTQNFWLLIPISVCLGLGGGAIDSALNNYVALHYQASQMSYLHCCWGIGATVAPLIMAYCISHSVWQNGYRVVAIIQVSLCILQFLSIKRWKDSRTDSTGKKVIIVGGSKPETKVLAMLCFFFYCSIEGSAFLWISTYFVQYYQSDPNFAAKASSALFLGMSLGRFISGLFANKIGVKKLIYIGSGLTILCFIALLLVNSATVALPIVLIIGLGFGPIYPDMIHRTPRRFGSELSPKIIGYQMAAAYIGSTCAPPLLGILFKSVSFQLLPMIGIVFVMIEVFLTMIIERGNKVV